MVTNSTDNKTHVWNVVFSNHTVEFSTLAYIEDPSMDKDGKPSMVINYNTTEDVWARVFKDEIRKVGHVLAWFGHSKCYLKPQASRQTCSSSPGPTFLCLCEPAAGGGGPRCLLSTSRCSIWALKQGRRLLLNISPSSPWGN